MILSKVIYNDAPHSPIHPPMVVAAIEGANLHIGSLRLSILLNTRTAKHFIYTVAMSFEPSLHRQSEPGLEPATFRSPNDLLYQPC